MIYKKRKKMEEEEEKVREIQNKRRLKGATAIIPIVLNSVFPKLKKTKLVFSITLASQSNFFFLSDILLLDLNGTNLRRRRSHVALGRQTAP